MSFSNLNVLPDELPSIESAIFNPLESDYLKVERIAFGISTLTVLLAGGVFFFLVKKFQQPMLIYISVVVFLLLAASQWIATSISFKHSGYALREKDIMFKRGWYIQKTGVVPLNRIQHVSVQSGPIERKFGLASVSLFTAGSDGADVSIRGISEATAQTIKEWISTRINGATAE